MNVQETLMDIALAIEAHEEPSPEHYQVFINEPEVALKIVDQLHAMSEQEVDDDDAYYSACLFALDVCVAQLQSAIERGHSLGLKLMDQVMSCLAQAITHGPQSLGFWLPVLNGFYDAHIELSDALRDAYYTLASADDEDMGVSDADHLAAMKALIEDLSGLTVFEMTEHFFAQSYAMPPDFFEDLVTDLSSIEEGLDIPPLMLLHPKQEVRDVVFSTLDQLMPHMKLSSISLTRLQMIQSWYPETHHAIFDRWINIQRLKGVIFHREKPQFEMGRLMATEVDGSGAQGVFLNLTHQKTSRLCGLLFKQGLGIKDVWITPIIPSGQVQRYYQEAFDDTVMLRPVDEAYFLTMTKHFLALTREQGHVPGLFFLEVMEASGFNFKPELLDVDEIMKRLSVQIHPFTPDEVRLSLKRSKSWTKNKRFTESWYIESTHIDKIVNQCSSFVQGVKVCRFEDAIAAVFAEVLERQRASWLFHFLWVALWLKAKGRANEKTWQDALMLAYVIQSGMSMAEIPLMHEICHEIVVNSIETMQDRGTYLHRG